MGSPMLMAAELEERKTPFPAPWERFRGYGVVASPFLSGHVLAFRRMTASSLGPAYTSVWHREPDGFWTMIVDVDPALSCPRFFSSAMYRVTQEEIELNWNGPRQLSVRVRAMGLQWGVRLVSDLVTRGMSWVGSLLPGPVWKNPGFRSAAGQLGGRALRVGKVSLSGLAPNGQRFMALPRALYRIEATAAVFRGMDLGPTGPLEEQTRLGDFWIPNAGLFAVGEAGFESRKQFL